jgi:hypothetical protein
MHFEDLRKERYGIFLPASQ